MTNEFDPDGSRGDVAAHASAGYLDRRRFLIATVGSAAAAGAYWSGHARHRVDAAGSMSIGVAKKPGQRGGAVQVAPTLPPPPPPKHWRAGQFITHVDVANRMMALTFDDGPSPWNTERVLGTLDRFGVKATFFLIGVNVRSWPDLARRTHEAGHELGNHSVYHTPLRASSLASQIGPNQDIIRGATGYTPIVSRAPALTRGRVILDTCAYFGLYECHTNMQTWDWTSPRRSAGRLYDDFVQYQRNGSFVLYHDGGPGRPTTDALPDIITYAQNLGYQFVTATELVNSGVPQPFTTSNRYGYNETADTTSNDPVELDENFVDVCNYDAAATLRSMLDGDLSITYADRMRIVEALADLEAATADS